MEKTANEKKKQFLYDFAMVEIFSSYFKKEIINSPRFETLFIYFRENTVENQCSAERDCIVYLEKNILPSLGELISHYSVNVGIYYDDEKERHLLNFDFGGMRISMYVIPPNGGSKMKVWWKTEELEN
jgi:hypothetical protein